METIETGVEITRAITKAKLAKNGGCEVEFVETKIYHLADGTEKTTAGEASYGGFNICHQDLLDAFKNLTPHFAIICDLREAFNYTLEDLVEQPELLANIEVRSFSIGGSGDTEGVTLSGFKKRGKKMLNFPTYFTQYNDENEPYEYGAELQHAILICNEQVNQYLDGKIAPDAQLSMDFVKKSGEGTAGDDEHPF